MLTHTTRRRKDSDRVIAQTVERMKYHEGRREHRQADLYSDPHLEAIDMTQHETLDWEQLCKDWHSFGFETSGPEAEHYLLFCVVYVIDRINRTHAVFTPGGKTIMVVYKFSDKSHHKLGRYAEKPTVKEELAKGKEAVFFEVRKNFNVRRNITWTDVAETPNLVTLLSSPGVLSSRNDRIKFQRFVQRKGISKPITGRPKKRRRTEDDDEDGPQEEAQGRYYTIDVKINLASLWYHSNRRRQIFDFVFCPYNPEAEYDWMKKIDDGLASKLYSKKYLNQWPGWDFDQKKAREAWKNCQFKDPLISKEIAAQRKRNYDLTLGPIFFHLQHVLCNNKMDVYRWVMSFFAHLFKFPEQRPHTSLIFKGGEGCGKGLFMEKLIKNMVGDKFFLQTTSMEEVVGNFTGAINNKMLIHFDEAYVAGQKKEYDERMKALATEDKQRVTYKYKNAEWVPFFGRLVFTSNKADCVNASEDARRWMLVECCEDWRKRYPQMNQKTYFDALAETFQSEAAQLAFGGYLLELDISAWNPNKVIQTDFLIERKLTQLSKDSSVADWWYYCLQRGRHVELSELADKEDVGVKARREKIGHRERLDLLVPPEMRTALRDRSVEWVTYVSVEDLHNAYQKYANGRKLRPDSLDRFKRELRKRLPSMIIENVRGVTKVFPRLVTAEDNSTTKAFSRDYVDLGYLDWCRKQFVRSLHAAVFNRWLPDEKSNERPIMEQFWEDDQITLPDTKFDDVVVLASEPMDVDLVAEAEKEVEEMILDSGDEDPLAVEFEVEEVVDKDLEEAKRQHQEEQGDY